VTFATGPASARAAVVSTDAVHRLPIALAALALVACKTASGGTVDPSHPVPEAYDRGSNFAGAWVGESNHVLGTLEVRSLGPGRYYGKFTSDDKLTKFVCNMKQPLVTLADNTSQLPGNLVEFTWQDGRGGQGAGWVLINPADSALAGEIQAGGESGPWTFVRRDSP